MFLRLRWFVLGALTSVGAGAWLVTKVKRMRARLTPENMRKASVLAAADALDWAGRKVAPPEGGPAGEPGPPG